MISRISDGYLKWLMDKVGGEEGEYIDLFKVLSNREFTWFVNNDENRAEDGLNLRDHYGYFTGLESLPCTVLEMLVGLSIRVGEEILWDGETDYVSMIFWEMIKNLHLEYETNANIDIEYIDDRLSIFLNREYDNNGDGALFKPNAFLSQNPKKFRKLEIWYQLQSWLTENF